MKKEDDRLYYESVLPLTNWYYVDTCNILLCVNFPIAFRSVVAENTPCQLRLFPLNKKLGVTAKTILKRPFF